MKQFKIKNQKKRIKQRASKTIFPSISQELGSDEEVLMDSAEEGDQYLKDLDNVLKRISQPSTVNTFRIFDCNTYWLLSITHYLRSVAHLTYIVAHYKIEHNS